MSTHIEKSTTSRCPSGDTTLCTTPITMPYDQDIHVRQQAEAEKIARHAERLSLLWGPRPLYVPQPEDQTHWWWGSIFYTWMNHVMSAAARGELEVEDLPKPTNAAGAHAAGITLSAVMQKQRQCRHSWDSFYGYPVTLTERHGGGKGVLLYVGPATQLDLVGNLYAAVHWEIAPTRPARETEAAGPGSFLFRSEWEGLGIHGGNEIPDDAMVTLEAVEHVRFRLDVLEDIESGTQPWARGYSGIDRAAFPRALLPGNPPRRMSVIRGLFQSFCGDIYRLGPLRALTDLTILAAPFVLQIYIRYLDDGAHSGSHVRDGAAIVALFFGTSFLHSVVYHRYSQLSLRCVFTCRNALSAAIFEKCLTISAKALARPDMSAGRVVNMLCSDVEQVEQLVRYFWLAVFLPFQFIGAMALLYRLVGVAAFAGAAVSLLGLPFQIVLTKRVYRCYVDLARATDARLKATNEFIMGIRTVKFMSWELLFLDRIKELRTIELREVRRSQVLWTVLSLCTDIIPDLSTALLFVAYYLAGHRMSAAIIYPAMSLIRITVAPIRLVPIFVHGLSSLFVSMQRLSTFLECPDSEGVPTIADLEASIEQTIDETRAWRKFAAAYINAKLTAYKTVLSPPPSTRVNVEHGSSDEFFEYRAIHVLAGISLRIPKGRFTVVVGPTGSGKSTLLKGLLGAVGVSEGSVYADPSVAYVPEQPWTMDATVKDNILFFSDYDEAQLARTVQCTQLEEDIQKLLNGLETHVGECGIPLSGGQQARLAMARAVYANKEVYLLDDPLSGLDPLVQECIVEQCLLGVLSKKTRVLATHKTTLIPKADYIVVMTEGRGVEFSGTYPEFRRYTKDNSYRGRRSDFVEFSTNALPSDEDLPTAEPREMESNPLSADTDGYQADVGSRLSTLAADEEKAKGGVPMSMYMRYGQSCGGWSAIVTTIVVFFATEVGSVSSSVWLSFWSDGRLPFLTGDNCFFVYVGLVLIGAFSLPLRYAVSLAYTRRACTTLHHELMESISRGTLSFFDATPRGRIINRFSRDMNELDSSLQFNLLQFLMFGFSLLSALSIMIISQYLTTLLVVPFVVFYRKILLFYCSANREIQRTSNICSSPIYSIIGETTTGRWIIQAFQKGPNVLNEAVRRLDVKYSCSYLQSVSEHWLAIRVELLNVILLTGLVGLGVLSANIPNIPVKTGLIYLIVSNANSLNAMLARFIVFGAALEASMNSVERITYYTDHTQQEHHRPPPADAEADDVVLDDEGAPEDVHERATDDAWSALSRIDTAGVLDSRSSQVHNTSMLGIRRSFAATERRPAFTPDPALRGALELRNVCMRYRPGHPLVLQNISVRIKPGQKVGVVGRSGSGKSSLMLALLRLMDLCEGIILVNGQDAAEYPISSLRRLFAIIPQDPQLFDGTIRSNLDPTASASDAVLWEILRQVGMHEKIHQIPDGLESKVLEGGSNLSVGQRQLLCLARALVKPGGCFLLMDEATANVDPELEHRIQQTVQLAFHTYTIITIAHHLQTVASYDVILVMDAGKLVAVGSPEALMDLPEGTPFRSLVTSMGPLAAKQFELALNKKSADATTPHASSNVH